MKEQTNDDGDAFVLLELTPRVKSVLGWLEGLTLQLDYVLGTQTQDGALYIARALLSYSAQVYIQALPDGSREGFGKTCVEAYDQELAKITEAERRD